MTASAQNFRTMKVGEYSSFSNSWNSDLGLMPVIGGDAIGVKLRPNWSLSVYGVRPGLATFSYYYNYNNYGSYLIHVLDVIPSEVELLVGGSYAYSPVVESNTDDYKTFTWSSNNTAVATVDANGKVNAVTPGRATITCIANGGNSFSSVVYVSNQPAQELKLNKKSQELEVGKSARLTATISPDNTTNKAVKWLSSNENIAQVDDNGNVTAIGAGYCSIYAKADDGSGKFAKCLIHVTGTAGSRSDVNGDGVVTVTDAEVVIEEILSQQ